MDTIIRQQSGSPDDRRGLPEVREGTRVLVVDDDHAIRETLRLLLEDEGYQVTEACDGVEALTLLRHECASYVTLLDLRMPRLDGSGLLGIVAEDPALASRHSFILMTADRHAMSRIFTDHLARRAVPTLSKPFDIDDLLDLVEQAQRQLTIRQQLAAGTFSNITSKRQTV